MCLPGFSKPDKKDAYTDKASGGAQTSSELILTTWKLFPVVLKGKKLVFLSSVRNLLHSEPVLPANNSLLLTEETEQLC